MINVPDLIADLYQLEIGSRLSPVFQHQQVKLSRSFQNEEEELKGIMLKIKEFKKADSSDRLDGERTVIQTLLPL